MATLNDICERAMRKIGVVAIDEPMTADQALHAQDAYNAMVAGWSLRGVEAPVAPATLSGQFPFPPRFEEAITYVLADHMAIDYSRPGMGMKAVQALRDIKAYLHVVPLADANSALMRTNSQRRWTYAKD